jgi:hypothetical protein
MQRRERRHSREVTLLDSRLTSGASNTPRLPISTMKRLPTQQCGASQSGHGSWLAWDTLPPHHSYDSGLDGTLAHLPGEEG